MTRRRRALPIRKAVPKLTITCDDTVTAPAYFRKLKESLQGVLILQIERVKTSETAPDKVVDLAIKSIQSGKTADSDADQAWAVIDAEPQRGREHATKINSALDNANRKGVRVCISNPCFEYWLHLHIEDCDGSHLTADDAVRALDDAWKKKFGSSYKKNSPKIARLATERRIEDARQRAKQQHRQKEQRNPHQCLPCVTDLYHLIDAINVIRSESTSSHQFPISD